MTDKQIIDNISNFCLACYYDNKTNELVHIEQYNDNDTSIHSDIESYKYGYNAEIVKPEQLIRQLDQLKANNKKMEKGYIELTEIVAPYIDDFTGYNEEQCGFDIVLCVKELMQQLNQLKEEVEKQKALKQTYLACYKTKHGDVKGKLFKYERYKEALQNIKRIIEVNKVELEECLAHDIDNQILQKISEALND